MQLNDCIEVVHGKCCGHHDNVGRVRASSVGAGARYFLELLSMASKLLAVMVASIALGAGSVAHAKQGNGHPGGKSGSSIKPARAL